jgi:hypothetical protein
MVQHNGRLIFLQLKLPDDIAATVELIALRPKATSESAER